VERPITGFTSNINNVSDLIKMILEVIDSATVQEREIEGRDSHWYQLRIQLYKTQDHTLDGAVVTLLPKLILLKLGQLRKCNAHQSSTDKLKKTDQARVAGGSGSST